MHRLLDIMTHNITIKKIDINSGRKLSLTKQKLVTKYVNDKTCDKHKSIT